MCTCAVNSQHPLAVASNRSTDKRTNSLKGLCNACAMENTAWCQGKMPHWFVTQKLNSIRVTFEALLLMDFTMTYIVQKCVGHSGL